MESIVTHKNHNWIARTSQPQSLNLTYTHLLAHHTHTNTYSRTHSKSRTPTTSLNTSVHSFLLTPHPHWIPWPLASNGKTHTIECPIRLTPVIHLHTQSCHTPTHIYSSAIYTHKDCHTYTRSHICPNNGTTTYPIRNRTHNRKEKIDSDVSKETKQNPPFLDITFTHDTPAVNTITTTSTVRTQQVENTKGREESAIEMLKEEERLQRFAFTSNSWREHILQPAYTNSMLEKLREPN